jgi:hypothetical protein
MPGAMPSIDYYKRKAATAVQRLAEAEAALAQASNTIKMVEAINADRACLISITRDNRRIKFTFVRNGQLTTIETMGTWDDDVDGWQRELLHRQGTNDG